MNNKRKILAVTGIRSEYDILSSVFFAITKHAQLDLELIVTGAHLSNSFGNTINEIESDGFKIVEKIESLIDSDSESARVKGLGIQIQGLVQAVERIKPDILLVLGDREEAITTALVGSYMNIPIAHISGGDRVIGNIDDQIRHAVTKLAHLHMVTNSESEERVKHLGEQAFRIHNVGNPGLDRLLDVPKLKDSELSKSLSFEVNYKKPFIILIQHPLSSEVDLAYEQMRITLDVLRQLSLPTIISHPNSDAGSQQVIKAIEEFTSLPFIHVVKNAPRLEFVNLMRHASCLIGNSSAGILEAPLLKLPVVNIGNRQKGRLHSENVEFVSHNELEIKTAIERAIYDEGYKEIVNNCKNPYGDGKSSQRIADLLASVKIDQNFLIKDITY